MLSIKNHLIFATGLVTLISTSAHASKYDKANVVDNIKAVREMCAEATPSIVFPNFDNITGLLNRYSENRTGNQPYCSMDAPAGPDGKNWRNDSKLCEECLNPYFSTLTTNVANEIDYFSSKIEMGALNSPNTPDADSAACVKIVNSIQALQDEAVKRAVICDSLQQGQDPNLPLDVPIPAPGDINPQAGKIVRN